jgi:ketosteroid isomerase-like protein
MSREVVLRYVDAWNRQDVEALRETLAPDVRVVRPRGTTIGRDEFIAAVRAQHEPEAADELEVTFHDRTIEEVGDKVTTTVRLDYHWRQSGEFSHSMTRRTEFTVRDGQIVEVDAGAPEKVDA